MSYYRGNLKRCQDYNAIVSYSQKYVDTTSSWSSIELVNGDYYILKHPDYDGTYLTEVQNNPNEGLIP